MAKYKSMKEYEKQDNVTKIATYHGSRGITSITMYLVKDSQKYYYSYAIDTVKPLKYMGRAFYWIVSPIVPIGVFLERLFEGDRPYFKSPDYKENWLLYRKFYRSNYLTRKLNSGNMYTEYYGIPYWANTNYEDAASYTKMTGKYSSLPQYKKEKLQKKYLGHTTDYLRDYSLVISMMAGIAIPESEQHETSERIDRYDL